MVIHVLAHTQGLGVPAIATEGVDFSIPLKMFFRHTLLKVDVFFPRTELGVHPILVFSAWSLGYFCPTATRGVISHRDLLLWL